MKTPIQQKAGPTGGGKAEQQIRAAATLRNRGVEMLKAGLAKEAEALLEEAITIFPGFAEAEIRIGNIHRGQNDMEGAAARYRRALAIKPDYPWAHLELAICLQRNGQPDAALEHYRQALRHNPKLYKTVLFALVDQKCGRFWLDVAALKQTLTSETPEEVALTD